MYQYHCDNCDFATNDGADCPHWTTAQDLSERLETGSIVPFGVCPDCGAFVYPMTVADYWNDQGWGKQFPLDDHVTGDVHVCTFASLGIGTYVGQECVRIIGALATLINDVQSTTGKFTYLQRGDLIKEVRHTMRVWYWG